MSQALEIKSLKNYVANLESQLDYLKTDFDYLNQLLIEVGFDEGINTLKETAEEFLANRGPNSHESFFN